MQIEFLKNKKRPPGKKRLVTLKLSGEELSLIRVKAAYFCDGDVSKWIRYAAMYLLPLEEHLDLSANTDPETLEMYGESRDKGSWRNDALRKELASFSRQFKKLEREKL
jgi:hypothetical protein